MIAKRLFVVVGCCCALAFSAPARGNTLTLAGPGAFRPAALPASRQAGIRLTALQDVTLTGFEFHGRGMADTLVLTDLSGAVLREATVPGGRGVRALEVDWVLEAGESYRLASLKHYNALWARGGGEGSASSNAHLSVDGAFDGRGRLYTDYWFGFSDLRTVSTAAAPAAPSEGEVVAVPVPPAAWGGTAILGVAAGFLYLRRRPVA